MSCCSTNPTASTAPLLPYEELRIVLLGKVRMGKSASGNTILGTKDLFLSEPGPFAVTTKCKKAEKKIGTQNVVVIDTPGLCNPETDTEVVVREIKRSISLSSPGPHVFVIVLSVTHKYTAEDEKMMELICNTFGSNVMAYTMVLFTHGDELTTSRDEFIQSSNSLLRLVTQCNWRCHVFDNNGSEDQAAELLQMINQQSQKAKTLFYTAEMLKEAEIAFEKQQVQNPTGGGAPATQTIIQTSAYGGLLAGCAMGYLIGGGEMTSTIGAVVGGIAGGVLASVVAGLVILARKKCCKKCCKK